MREPTAVVATTSHGLANSQTMVAPTATAHMETMARCADRAMKAAGR